MKAVSVIQNGTAWLLLVAGSVYSRYDSSAEAKDAARRLRNGEFVA